MKKCRARYGLDQQNQWCKPCRCVPFSLILGVTFFGMLFYIILLFYVLYWITNLIKNWWTFRVIQLTTRFEFFKVHSRCPFLSRCWICGRTFANNRNCNACNTCMIASQCVRDGHNRCTDFFLLLQGWSGLNYWSISNENYINDKHKFYRF
jgi:hypothetical protein